MPPKPHTPRQALNKAYLKLKPNRKAIDLFKGEMSKLMELSGQNQEQHEEFHKNLVSEFLKKTYYQPNFYINIHDRNDLVIHNGPKPKSPVGVIIEVKKPGNKPEMISKDQLNAKAMQELLLYYLRERITQNNLDLKHLIATNVNEWFVFDANLFEKAFANDKALVKQFKDFEAGRMSGNTTDFFYKNVARPAIEQHINGLDFTHFDLNKYQKALSEKEKREETKQIPLFKVLSPEHLLKLPFTNDSNSLDRRFYTELLHIIGLGEIKQGGKKVIERKKEGERSSGSLLENAILQLDTLDKIGRLENPSQYGQNHQERLFNVALELVITWVNRILFLKLLEAQLLRYHKGDQAYAFLNGKKIHNFDDMNSLFFQALARKHSDRSAEVEKLFSNVPYLNSSLFEPTELEHTTLFISQLQDEKTIPILTSTVLKDELGKKRTSDLEGLSYLFEFLNAYDFSSEGSEEIQEENKTLINASVLGLIFEKINGYKDGSFFTPGFITMYMCRETIRRAVVQKFNEVKSWDCKDLDDLYEQIDDRAEANKIIDELKICDPAVGSGHFLVSALNEIISIKSDLKILQDRQGKRLKEYQLEVVNDELIITDDDGELFDYHPANKESQRVQEALFHEKQTIIENCLFGVDINPNSVKICRLRLWIELLKNAYYTEGGQLETLPNIDINIKNGNSLISRFALDADMKDALKKSKWTIESYRLAVDTYRNAQSKEEKREMERLIGDIKSDFRSEIARNDPKMKKLSKTRGELLNLTTQTGMFEKSAKEQKAWQKDVDKLTKEIQKREAEIEEIKSNKIYEDAFEWRFEFPEVLDSEGKFTGFDVVIGNPPYIRIQDMVSDASVLDYYNQSYQTTGSGNYDIYIPFIELAIRILSDQGEQCFIMPHKFTNANYGEKTRVFLSDKSLLRRFIDFGAHQVFDDATTYTGLFFCNFAEKDEVEYVHINNFDNLGELSFEETPYSLLSKSSWVFLASKEAKFLQKLQKELPSLEVHTDRIFQGLKTSADKIFILEKIIENDKTYEVYCREDGNNYELEKSILFPLIKGGNSRPYHISETELLILFPYIDGELIEKDKLSSEFPKTWSYLNRHKPFLENREKGSFKDSRWYRFGRNQAIDIIGVPKLFTPDIAPSSRFSFDEAGVYMFTGGAAGGYGIIPKNTDHFLYLLTILNGKVANWYISKTSTQMRGGWYSFESRYIKSIPIPDPAQGSTKLDKLVKEVINFKKQNPNNDTTYLEQQIDQLVYELYGLTDEEIKIVENTD